MPATTTRFSALKPQDFFSLWSLSLCGFKDAQNQLMRSMIEEFAHNVGGFAHEVFPQYFKDENPGKTFGMLKIGDTVSATYILSPQRMLYFARASDDWGAPHFDKEYIEIEFTNKRSRFDNPIAHGLLVASLISPVLAHDLPGKGTVYVSQSLKFVSAVFINDKVTVVVKIISLDPKTRMVTLSTTITKEDGTVAIEGEAVVKARKV